MKQEIGVALDLLAAYIQRFGSVKEETIDKFRTKVEQNLLQRYQGHWYPGTIKPHLLSSYLYFLLLLSFFLFVSLEKPIKGQAYRSLEFNKENDYCDAIVSQVCNDLGFSPHLLGIRHELTLWIDPCEVTVRYAVSS